MSLTPVSFSHPLTHADSGAQIKAIISGERKEWETYWTSVLLCKNSEGPLHCELRALLCLVLWCVCKLPRDSRER